MIERNNSPIGIVIMDNEKYPIYEENKFINKTGPNGEDLYAIVAKHPKYGRFSIDACKNNVSLYKWSTGKRVLLYVNTLLYFVLQFLFILILYI